MYAYFKFQLKKKHIDIELTKLLAAQNLRFQNAEKCEKVRSTLFINTPEIVFQMSSLVMYSIL